MLNIYFTQCGVDEHAGRQLGYNEEQPSVNMTPKIDYEVTDFDYKDYISINYMHALPPPPCQKNPTTFLSTFYTTKVMNEWINEWSMNVSYKLNISCIYTLLKTSNKKKNLFKYF